MTNTVSIDCLPRRRLRDMLGDLHQGLEQGGGVVGSPGKPDVDRWGLLDEGAVDDSLDAELACGGGGDGGHAGRGQNAAHHALLAHLLDDHLGCSRDGGRPRR
jgi:hypothetical protein